MRVLLYNWVPAGSRIKEGGGVALYLANLAESLTAAGCEVSVLSSGFRYGLMDDAIRIVERPRGSAGQRYFDVMNSPVAAPSFFMLGNVSHTIRCPALVDVVRDFLNMNGPFDVFHIQNIEGISFDVLTLAEEFPAMRIILTNHNYHVLCQQANLWRQDKARCAGVGDGASCHTCNVFPVDLEARAVERFMAIHGLDQGSKRVQRAVHRGLSVIAKAGRSTSGGKGWRNAAKADPDARPRMGPADRHLERRERALDLVNRHCDEVVSVSRATEAILLKGGLDPRKSRVSYIGTRHYDPASTRRRVLPAPHLRLAFLGYTRPDKGFQFLADALEAMPQELEGRFSLKIAARISDRAAIARVEACEHMLAGLEIQDGYSQSELPTLLEDVDLGLVLPQWDDALPQVAIEFVCNGVPILTTDRGGQQELAGDVAFIFPAQSEAGFWRRLDNLDRNRDELERFWSLPRPLRTNAQHVQELLCIYRGETARIETAPVAAARSEYESLPPVLAERGFADVAS